jgi:hypothetical protein
MKKKLPIILSVCLFITTVVFFGLWQREKQAQEDIINLCRASAASAVTSFSEFKEFGHESSYWAGLSDFRVFQQAYYFLVEGTNDVANYTFCNDVYGHLLLSPMISQNNIDEVISVMKVVANDLTDPNGIRQMADLRNNMQEQMD